MFNEFLNQLIGLYNMITSNQPNNWDILISVIVQLLIIIIILFFIYTKIIKGTSSETLVKGIVILVFGWLFGEILIKFNFYILGAFIRAIISVIAISLVVIFQPELRRLLNYLGQTNFWKKIFFPSQRDDFDAKTNIVKELTETVKYLSKTKTGGLIVIQTDDSQSTYSEVGTIIDAKITAELLLTIFFPNTPLHDGAVVIKDERIISAGVLLPLTEDPKLSWRYGTRHRAAIGVTEINDCASIVVSEETGDISIAVDGVLKKYKTIADFKTDLQKILKIEEEKKEKLPQRVFEFINFKNQETKNTK